MKPYYEENGIVIYNADCREVLPSLPKVDAVISDPPYGINWKPRVNHQDQAWIDDKTANVRDLLPLAPLHCFWGGNYFTDQLPPSESWLIWLKRPSGFDDDPRTYSPCEMAWTDFGGKPRIKTHVWDGGKRAGESQNRSFCHPAQKPVEIMWWCVGLTTAQTILDPFMGSGTTLRAAKDLGRKAIGIRFHSRNTSGKRTHSRNSRRVLQHEKVTERVAHG